MPEGENFSFLKKNGEPDMHGIEALLQLTPSRLQEVLKEAGRIARLRQAEQELKGERKIKKMASQVSLAVSLGIAGGKVNEDELWATILGISGHDKNDSIKNLVFGTVIPSIAKACGGVYCL